MVFSMVINPEKNQLSGGNIYGIPLEVPPAEQFKLLRKLIPDLRKIGVLYDPAVSGELVEKGNTEARKSGLSLETVEVHSSKEVPGAVHSLKDKVDAIWMVPDRTVYSEESLPFIFAFTLDEKIPFLAFSESFVEAGALLSLSPDYEEMGRLASQKIDDVLNGRPQNPNPAMKYRLVINLKTARKIHLDIPKAILTGASRLVGE